MKKTFEYRYFSLPPQDIAYLRFILESYDGLCFMRTLDNRSGVLEVAWPASQRADAQQLLAALQEEVALHQIPPPEIIPPL
ncbi:DUF4911 domain-containing protein [Geoalkalibacter subterraneus]|jgi:hypothetical protein|uniref:DUF4911 domain-containing protein n=1 Tax=Geoalkalibacter subterraneus TaxID=483547 RepID=A0A0B5FC86_9BACT|nr:DUF4911 domain-containing protein [Geoalkalibacter subterraneus]AJF05792.1 hypothetical protein GSUB_03285 [Geoalkalibacter subterraneus]